MIRLATLLLAALIAVPAQSHWLYSRECCSDQDCAPIADDAVELTPEGWRIKASGEVIPFHRAKESPDGRFHRCLFGTDPAGMTRCLYAPPFGS